jgi:uncharacterized protein (UPF0548 family)
VRLSGADRSHETDVVVVGSGEACFAQLSAAAAVGVCVCGRDASGSCIRVTAHPSTAVL